MNWFIEFVFSHSLTFYLIILAGEYSSISIRCFPNLRLIAPVLLSTPPQRILRGWVSRGCVWSNDPFWFIWHMGIFFILKIKPLRSFLFRLSLGHQNRMTVNWINVFPFPSPEGIYIWNIDISGRDSLETERGREARNEWSEALKVYHGYGCFLGPKQE